MGLLTRAPVRMERVAGAMRRGAVSAIVGIVATVLVPDVVAQESWRPELRLQLEEEHGCELDFLTSVRVKHLDGRLLVNVRAHCKDGRTFDAKRDGVLMPFEIRRFLIFAETLATRPLRLDTTLGVIAVPAGLDVLMPNGQRDPM